MNRLVEEYFKRDLTEAEEEQLARELESSPEEAGEFARSMAKLYQDNGLPEPVWTERPLPAGRSARGFLKALIPALLILLLLGSLAYRFLARNNPLPILTAPAPTPGQPVEQFVPKKQKAAVQTHSPARPKTVSASSVPTLPVATAVPALPPGLVPPPLTAPPPITPPAAPAPGRQYQELSVVVEPTAAGLVTVRVYDSQNSEVRTLFAGIVPVGQRTFTWDGKTDSGAVAPAGTYFIEVKSGENVMRRQVQVQGDGN